MKLLNLQAQSYSMHFNIQYEQINCCKLVVSLCVLFKISNVIYPLSILTLWPLFFQSAIASPPFCFLVWFIELPITLKVGKP